MSSQHIINRRIAFEEAKGTNIVTGDMENESSDRGSLMGRRQFLLFGGAVTAVAVGTAGAAAALIRAGGSTPSARSQIPVGLDPVTGRNDGAVPLGGRTVKYYALAGTDGFATMPSASLQLNGGAIGAADIDPYFPDPLAPAGRTTYCFSFRNVTGLDREQVAAQKGHTELCAPLFYSTVGDELWLTMTNLGLALRPDLVDSHTIHWHGFRNAIPFYDGVPESSISVPIGRSFTYVYRPEDAGTYMYHCHFEDVEHVTMGMHGIVFVKPNPTLADAKVGWNTTTNSAFTLSSTQQKAYGSHDGDVKGESWYDREFAIMLSEVDARAHFNDAHIQATDWTDFHANFWTMNGRAYPDTLAPNSVRSDSGELIAQIDGGIDSNGNAVLTPNPDDRLASNPLSSLVQGKTGERVLIRFANLGFLNHSIVFPGLEIDVIGRDARFVPDSARREQTDTIQIGPGESRDVLITLTESGIFPFYDRGMSHYTGSEDGSDPWVGGQRSEIRVYDDLAPQLKPSGWAGEALYDGEQPMEAKHAAPAFTNVTTARSRQGGTISGTVQVDVAHVKGLELANLWWADGGTRTTASAAPAFGSTQWNAVLFDPTGVGTYGFHANVGGGRTSHWYWLLAQDSNGATSAAYKVQKF